MSASGEDRVSVNTHVSSTTVHTLAGRQDGRPRPADGPAPPRLRFMQRDGAFPVVFKQGAWSPFLLDIYSTLVETRWRVMLLLFSLSYILSWLLLALVYWLIAYAHGDLAVPGGAPCVANVHSFTAAFLFSVETQATIGYGFRGTTENCMAAIVAVTAQSLLSCLIDTVVIGVAVAKMASARKRALTVGFSRCAVVNLRDGALCLSWRLGDFRGNHLVEGVARAQVVRYVARPSGAVEVVYRDLELEERDVILAAPATIVHRLDASSPLSGWRPADRRHRAGEGVTEEDFELVVSFTYTGDTTGMLHQTRTSYTASDIRWGQRFQGMLRLDRRGYKADYALFNQTSWVSGPTLGAEEEGRLRKSRPVRGSGSTGPRGGPGKGRSPRGVGGRPEPAEEVVWEAHL